MTIKYSDRDIIKYQISKIKNQEKEIAELKTIVEYQMKAKEIHLDTIHEQKNIIERQEILIDKMKRCENCKYDYPGTGEDFDDICHRCEYGSEWELYNE